MEEVFPTAKREMCPSEEMSGLMIQIWKSWTYNHKTEYEHQEEEGNFFFQKRIKI